MTYQGLSGKGKKKLKKTPKVIVRRLHFLNLPKINQSTSLQIKYGWKKEGKKQREDSHMEDCEHDFESGCQML